MEADGLIVIGAGHMRTGTMSLKLALERLLGGKCHHMKEVLFDPVASRGWTQACQSHGGSCDALLLDLMTGYNASVDYPSALFYKDLMRLYPRAKVILSERDPDSWVRSIRQTTLSVREMMNDNVIVQLLLRTLSGIQPNFLHSVNKRLAPHYGHFTDEDWRKLFVEWNEEVRRNVPADRLLVFQAKEGWEPLCRFLNVPIPQEPYPFVNSTEEFRQRLIPMRVIGTVVRGFTVATMITLVGFLAYLVQDKFKFLG